MVDRLGVWCAGARLSVKCWLVEEMPFGQTLQSYKEIYLEAPYMPFITSTYDILGEISQPVPAVGLDEMLPHMGPKANLTTC